MDIKEGLVTKVGPFPAWVYGVLGGGGIALFMFMKRRKGGGTVSDPEFQAIAETPGWGAAPYAPGPVQSGGYDSTGGGVDMSGVFDSFAQIYSEMELSSAERFEQYQRSLDEQRAESALTLQEQRDAQAVMLREQQDAQRASQEQLIAALQAQSPPPAPEPAYVAPPPPPAPTPAPAPAPAPAKTVAAGTLLWNGPNKPNLETIRKAFGTRIKVVENTGHKPGSSHRWIVVAT